MFKFTLLAAAGVVLLAGCASNLTADDPAADEVSLVRDAERVAERFTTDADFRAVNDVLRDAVAVVVMPDVVKGGFIFGAETGNGVLLARRGGGWSDPTFVTAGAGSVGFQIGGQVQDVMMIIRNQGALNALLDDSLSLGAEGSVAAGPIGAGVEGRATTNLDADVVVFADAVGAFAGVALEGAVLAPRAQRNADYYGAPTTPRQAIGRTSDARSAGLRAALN